MKIPPNIVVDGSEGPKDWKGKWDPAGWAHAVNYHLDKILSREVGRAILNEARSKTITIVPTTASDTSKKETDARFFSPRTVGTGAAKIFFLPKIYDRHSSHYIYGARSVYSNQVRPYGRLHPTADQTLLHEFAHAMRIVTGKGKADDTEWPIERPDWLGKTKVPPMAYLLQYDVYGEILAILLANVYYAEANNDRTIFKFSRRQMFMRQDHAGYTPLLLPSKFLDHGPHLAAATDLRRNHEHMSWQVALAPAAFNPIRDILINSRPREFFDRFTGKYKARVRKEFYDIAFERLAAKVTMPVLENWQSKLGRDVIPPPPVHPAFLSS